MKWFESKIIVPKLFVDAIGDEMDRLRHIQRSYNLRVPDEAVDHCRSSYRAAKGDDEVADSSRFDDKGLFVCLCRHGIPILLINMDSPGEQQKYVIAALKRLFSMLPPSFMLLPPRAGPAKPVYALPPGPLPFPCPPCAEPEVESPAWFPKSDGGVRLGK